MSTVNEEQHGRTREYVSRWNTGSEEGNVLDVFTLCVLGRPPAPLENDRRGFTASDGGMSSSDPPSGRAFRLEQAAVGARRDVPEGVFPDYGGRRCLARANLPVLVFGAQPRAGRTPRLD
ncbi:hypothetical protein EYF80_025989 [Liparis tanakae]|uniref:Uncharacterized protein n=1 Tax=Liparis tanakae TaxID=230148 RepID=A0A4Z2HD31_9TELE|nr:hypothetical protein EYF80_025989 [Liparis tanakae]